MRSKIPNYFIVGAPRCGTTSVVELLRQYPEIFLPEVKEPKFFSVPDNHFPHCGPGDQWTDSLVVKKWDQYIDLFEKSVNEKCIIDASVDYLYFPGVAGRIHKKSPDAQILILLRDPVFRAFSAYKYMVWSGRETLTFKNALQEEESRKALNWEFFWHYKSVGFYYQQVKRYIEVFGRKNVHIFLSEDLQSNPDTLEHLLNVFGISDFSQKVKLKRLNRSGIPRLSWFHHIFHSPNMLNRIGQCLIPQYTRRKILSFLQRINKTEGVLPESTRTDLFDTYTSDILALQSLIKQDLSRWLSIREKTKAESYH